MEKVTLFAPKVRYFSTDESGFDPMLTWRAEVEMAYLDDGDTPDVLDGASLCQEAAVGEL